MLPWRATRDPWAVLVSEVMLHQTQVERVVPAYRSFLDRFPTPASCAAAPLADVLRIWHGLGYPRRARQLHTAARAVVDDHRGRVPETLDALLALPGVGPYTARAVLVFAFEHQRGVVDTNVGRILARWVGRRLTAREAQSLADDLVPEGRGWDWNQALFDLGALVCRRRSPDCAACPVARGCDWATAGRPEPDPADGSAATSRRQSRFEGSDRQLRGRLLGALVDGPVARGEVGPVLGVGARRTAAVVDGLVADGLVEDRAGELRLPD